MQVIHDNVAVFVTQRDLQARAPKPDGPSTALQYVAENAGFDVVTFRVDFSDSAGIKLHRPAERTDHDATSTNTVQKSTQALAFECELHPFERRVLAYVVKRGKKRAFVRVQYAVITVVTPSIDVVVEAQERLVKMLMQQLQRSNDTFNHISKWKALPRRPGAEVDRACAEINRYFQHFGEVFVDASFPPEPKSLHDSGTPNKLSDGASAIYTLCAWEHLRTIADSSWTFVAPPKVRSKLSSCEPASSSSFTSGLPAQDSFLCALSIIAPYCEMWLHRWFPSFDAVGQVENMAAIPVALCDRGLTWQYLLIDLFLPSFPLGRGLMTPRNIHGELYAAFLHKAYAKLKGSYVAVSSIPTMTILRELTGSPWVCFYRRSAEDYVTDPLLEQVQLQEAVQATLSHRRPESDKISSLVIVTCGTVDDHYRAFQLTIPRDEDSRMTSVVLHDASGKYLREQIAGHIAQLDRDQDSSALRLSWEQLLALKPTVWSLSLSRRHEQRLRQIFLHQSDTVKMTAVFSVPTLTTIVFSSSYSVHFTSEACSQQLQVDLELSIALVETDFSVTPIEGNTTDGLATTSMRSQNLADNRDGVFINQVVRTLSAGEYVVKISVKRSGRDPSKAEEVVSASDKVVLTPTSVDANLQLVFDCLDREGRHELSESDITGFLQLYECETPSQLGKEALRSFLHQNGNSPSPGSEEWRLTLDNFRELYLGQAIQDCNAAHTNSPSSRTLCSDSIRARFQKLVWEDLLRLLSSDLTRSEIDCRDVVDVVCSFHSETPLISIFTLPEEKSSFDSNNFNI